MTILLEVLIAFLIREFMLHLFEGKLGMDVLFWSLGIVALVGARVVSFFIVYQRVKSSYNSYLSFLEVWNG